MDFGTSRGIGIVACLKAPRNLAVHRPSRAEPRQLTTRSASDAPTQKACAAWLTKSTGGPPVVPNAAPQMTSDP